MQLSNILASRSSQAILARLRQSNPSTTTNQISTEPPDDSNPLQAILNQSNKQSARNQECLYRTCAGITSFAVKDPDPFAVDGGKVLGVRIEAFAGGKFLRPYYVFFNKPYEGSKMLRVHRHTVPPCIILEALAKKHLPTPPESLGESMKVRKQNLSKFLRMLRWEIASYHNRVAAIAWLRKACGLDKKGKDKGKGREQTIRDISAADAEAKQIRLEWVDERVGRVVIDNKGEIKDCIVTSEEGRDRDTERKILGGNRRVEELVERLQE